MSHRSGQSPWPALLALMVIAGVVTVGVIAAVMGLWWVSVFCGIALGVAVFSGLLMRRS